MQQCLLAWYDEKKRALPWRAVRDPYAIWLSEIMLQQTRVETVIDYFRRFMERFPTVQALAEADEQAVLKVWEGLGYYSRARNLRKCALAVAARPGGAFPAEVEALRALPGIGPYTAGAIASIAFGVRTPAVDGNVERVVSRFRGIREDVGIPSVKRRLWAEADALVPEDRPGDFNQAMMELGARVCQPAPRCEMCPVRALCDAFEAGDADALPIKQRKSPQRITPRGVALVILGGRVLLHRREERLLQGLWCFPGFDHQNTPEMVLASLQKAGIDARFVASLGNARHAFTHLIWEMALYHFDAMDVHCPDGWLWADRDTLAALPLPTAMKAAKTAAEALLCESITTT